MTLPLIHIIGGARPNFMKIAPIYKELLKSDSFDVKLVHTGQHYDYEMSHIFFEELGMGKPHHFLDVKASGGARTIGQVITAYEDLISEEKPNIVLVVGDVDSTVACGLVARRNGIELVHVEAGLRSFDETMPEEHNRRLTDALSTLLLTPSKDGDENLAKEGAKPERVVCAGNIMIDTYCNMKSEIAEVDVSGIVPNLASNFAVLTIHRPGNVDEESSLRNIVKALGRISEKISLVLPLHPRTKKNLETFGLMEELSGKENIHLLSPVGYAQFMALVEKSTFVLTDSGGIQEETTYIGKPCLTLRPNTERPITIISGTNSLVTLENLESEVEAILKGSYKEGQAIPLWDGKTAERIVKVLEERFASQSAAASLSA